MSKPTSIHARKFYRVALQRQEDAEILMRNNRFGAAVYLAGYAVECMLKALVLASSPASRQEEIVRGFRGARGHSFDALREEYKRCGMAPIPKDVAEALLIVNRWDVDLRYEPSAPRPKLVRRFVEAGKRVCDWAEGRF